MMPRNSRSTRRSSPLRGVERRLQGKNAEDPQTDGHGRTPPVSQRMVQAMPGWLGRCGNPCFFGQNYRNTKELSKSLAIPEHFLYNARGINFVMRDKICPDTMLGKRWREDDAG